MNKSENLSYQNLIDFIDKFEIYLLKTKIKPQKNIIVIFDNSKLLTLLFLSIISTQKTALHDEYSNKKILLIFLIIKF